MAAMTLYICGCGKQITTHIAAPQYEGIMSVHRDGSHCSSMFEGDCKTDQAQRAQAQLTTREYRARALKERAQRLLTRAYSLEAR
jgi:siroheme synthase